MNFPEGDWSGSPLAMGIFALYVVVVSLLRLLKDEEPPRLTAMKKSWGRRRGLLLHFVANVGLPLVAGIVFLSRGVIGLGGEEARRFYDPVPHSHLVRYITPAQPALLSPPPAVDPYQYHFEWREYPLASLERSQASS